MTPIASQWILRRVTGNVSYQDMGRAPVIEWAQLAPGVHKMQGCSHAMIIVEMRDPFCRGRRAAVEACAAPVARSIKQRFPGNRFATRSRLTTISIMPAGFARLWRRARREIDRVHCKS